METSQADGNEDQGQDLRLVQRVKVRVRVRLRPSVRVLEFRVTFQGSEQGLGGLRRRMGQGPSFKHGLVSPEGPWDGGSQAWSVLSLASLILS